MMRWDPGQYGKFAAERGRPFADLISRIDIAAPRRVVDVGCGPGELTALLADRWPNAVIEGFDLSPEMVERAQRHARAGLSFRVADAASWRSVADTDVVVSNATLQWVPQHQDLLTNWARALPPGGWLAVQVPGNFDAPSHALMRELAESPRWCDRLAGVLGHHDSVATPSRYAELLMAAGLTVDVWETTYVHVLTGTDPVLEWVRGTGLRPVLGALSPAETVEFEQAYAAALRTAYPPTPTGTLFPFRRIFAVANRAA
jgi:trans-aconitate 2-methyltransferase